MVLMVDFFAMCSCPTVWHGVVPPSCLVHNPPLPGVTWTTTATTSDHEPATRKERRKRKKRRH